MPMRSFEENLRLYSKLTVKEGLALRHGQELLIYADLDQANFVHLIAEEAYRAGAKNVEVLWRDPDLMRLRIDLATDAALEYAPQWLHDGVVCAHKTGAARLGIISGDPALLQGIPADRVAIASNAHANATRGISEIVAGNEINWCIVGASSPGWASRVFPNIPTEEAIQQLWQKIFLASRIHEADPLGAWRLHSESLESKVRWLNELNLDALHFRGPGTDLHVGLAQNHAWAGGRMHARNGVTCSANIPTEEVFTMPHRERVRGIVSSTLPLSLRGQIVDKICVEFEEGAAKSVSAEVGEEALRKLVSADDGAARLGEVALVPASSLVAQTATLFLNLLYDENAASHIAFGACYAENMSDYASFSEEERLSMGANESIVHTDWMIGSNQIDVDGMRANGTVVPLMRSGEWV